jgi:putative membrane protein
MRDKRFVKEASKGGLAEEAMGRLALEKAHGAGVKQLGQKLVDDHSKANQELKQLAQQKGLDLADSTDKKADKHIEHLKSLSGAEFDRAFVQHMIKDHEKDIKKFETQAKKGKDAELKAFAEKCLPKLREHQAMAQKLSTEHRAGTGINEPAGSATSPAGTSTSGVGQNSNNSGK